MKITVPMTPEFFKMLKEISPELHEEAKNLCKEAAKEYVKDNIPDAVINVGDDGRIESDPETLKALCTLKP